MTMLCVARSVAPTSYESTVEKATPENTLLIYLSVGRRITKAIPSTSDQAKD
jgi:hypothetical protein